MDNSDDMEPVALRSLADTEALGARIAAGLRAGDVVALCGGLGAGKTHLCQAIVRALGSDEPVSSPTFTLVHEYREGRLPVFHLDFYRMKSEEEVLGVGWDDCLDAGGVCLVEWADLFPALLPPETQWWRLTLPPDGERVARRLRPGETVEDSPAL